MLSRVSEFLCMFISFFNQNNAYSCPLLLPPPFPAHPRDSHFELFSYLLLRCYINAYNVFLSNVFLLFD